MFCLKIIFNNVHNTAGPKWNENSQKVFSKWEKLHSIIYIPLLKHTHFLKNPTELYYNKTIKLEKYYSAMHTVMYVAL